MIEIDMLLVFTPDYHELSDNLTLRIIIDKDVMTKFVVQELTF